MSYNGVDELLMTYDEVYPSNNEWEIPSLLPSLQGGPLVLPFTAYGADSRRKNGVGTYHFYVDDYRFANVWKRPNRVINSGALAIVEPNLSLYDTTPFAYVIAQIYKKRWFARYCQQRGLRVYADMNVSSKFYTANIAGLPSGWCSFATRAYADRLDGLFEEWNLARMIANDDERLVFLVYGGGKEARQFCATHKGCIFIEQLMQKRKIQIYGKE